MQHTRIAPARLCAFTLVELSVVLVIIGLLVGGVMIGVNLLKQTEIKTITTDYSKYSTAVTQFRQQYGGFPGDLIDATSFWGDDSTNCSDALVTNGAPGTCNGDSDGDMSDNTGASLSEPYRAWQHLVLAEYLQGNYTGVYTVNAVPGTNVPRSTRITNGAWSFGNNTAVAGNANWYSENLSNYLAFGSVTSALTQGPVITPTHAWQLDTKMDNGLPGTGRILAMKRAFSTPIFCTTTDVDATAAYNVTDTSDACSLMMSLTLK